MHQGKFPRWPAMLVMAAGVVLHFYEVGRHGNPGDLVSIIFLVYGSVPYLIPGVIVWHTKSLAFPLLVGGVAALALDLVFYYDVFIAPGSSTAGILMLFAPMVCIFFGLAPGMLVGLVGQWAYRRLRGITAH